jgi:hypothetical protein
MQQLSSLFVMSEVLLRAFPSQCLTPYKDHFNIAFRVPGFCEDTSHSKLAQCVVQIFSLQCRLSPRFPGANPNTPIDRL